MSVNNFKPVAANAEPQELEHDIQGGGGSVSNLITKVTYKQLKTLRDTSKLVPGMQYRIVDYVTTTTQIDTRSADHQFDIIVTADDDHTLNENARACIHDGDTYFLGQPEYKLNIPVVAIQHIDDEGEFHEGEYALDHDNIFQIRDYLDNGTPVIYVNDAPNVVDEYTNYYKHVDQIEFNGQLCDRWLYVQWNTERDHYYGFFQHYVLTPVVISNNKFITGYLDAEYPHRSKLECWKIKYCLDNDTSRFCWAVDSDYKESPVIPVVAFQVVDDEEGPTGEEGDKTYWDTGDTYVNAGYSDDGIPMVTLRSGFRQYTQTYLYIGKSMWKGRSCDVWKSSLEYGSTSLHNHILTKEVVDSTGKIDEKWLKYKTISGKGVIYHMVDEYNNECSYDFKNIQFKRYYSTDHPLLDLASNYTSEFFYGEAEAMERAYHYIKSIPEYYDNANEFIWMYTFNFISYAIDKGWGECVDATIYRQYIKGFNLWPHRANINEYHEYPIGNNVINSTYVSSIIDEEETNNTLYLNNVVFSSWFISGQNYGIYNNIIGSGTVCSTIVTEKTYNINIGCEGYNINIGSDTHDIVISNSQIYDPMTIGLGSFNINCAFMTSFVVPQIGNQCHDIIIIGNESSNIPDRTRGKIYNNFGIL